MSTKRAMGCMWRRAAALALYAAAALSCVAPAHALTPPAPVLSAPESVSGSYTVSWTGNAGSAEDRYTLEESGNNGSTWTVRINNSAVVSWTAPVQSGSRMYRAKHCQTLSGTTECSPWSATRTVHIQPTGTPAIGCTGCTSPDINGDLTITWTKPSGTITHYRVFSRRNGSCPAGGNWCRTEVAGANTLSLPFDDLADGNWEFQVDACNTVLGGNCSLDDSAIHPVTVLKTPGVPGGVTLPASDTDGTFTLDWDAATGSVAKYEVYRRPNGTSSFTKITDRTPSSYTPANHDDGKFDFAVKACTTGTHSGNCSGYSAVKTIDVLKVPTVPTDPGVQITGLLTPQESGNLRLQWNDSQQTVGRYEVSRSYDGDTCGTGTEAFAKVDETTVSEKQYSAHADGAYRYRVKACNASGCSLDSGAVCVVIAKSPTGLPDAVVERLPVPARRDFVGTLPGSASIDGGNVNYRIDIPVPPGRNGMAPKVSLSYGSGQGEGIAGVGWNLSAGQGSVYRCPTLEAIDGATAPYSGALSDRLCLDGEQLLLASGQAASQYGTGNSTYHPETKPFMTVRLSGASTFAQSSLSVVDRAGVTRIYAEPVIPPREQGGVAYPTHWLLTRTRDLHGNTIDYRYTGNDEEPLLDKVLYTGFCSAQGNCNEGTRVVDLDYEARPQRLVAYNSQGFRTVASQRLASITTKLAGPDQEVLHVKLRYKQSDVSGRSLLAGVQLCNDEGCAESYPESRFDYAEQKSSVAELKRTDSELMTLIALGDIDGDGRQDHAVEEKQTLNGPRALTELRISSEAAPRPIHRWMGIGLELGSFAQPYYRDRPLVDFNSDGRTDLVRLTDGRLEIGTWNRALNDIEVVETDLQIAYLRDMRDFDRDGDTDVASFNHVFFNCAGEQTLDIDFCAQTALPSLPPGASEDYSFKFVDIDGDSLPDGLFYGTSDSGNPLAAHVSFGQMSNGVFSFAAPVTLSSLGGPSEATTPIGLDVNGDGLSDFFEQRNDGSPHLWLNVGKGRFAEVTVHGAINVSRYLKTGLLAMDHDGDGRDDLLVPDAGEVVSDYCYLLLTGEDVEELPTCATGNLRFDTGSYPHKNRAVYGFDRVRLIPQDDGTYALERADTPLYGAIHATTVCDANDDGLDDLCFVRKNEYGQNPNLPNCREPDEPCLYAIGRHSGNAAAQLGTFAVLSSRSADAFAADALTQAINGLGYVDRWNYGALSGAGHGQCSYSAEDPFYGVSLAAPKEGHYHFSAAKTAVTRHSMSNGIGAMNAECYRYEDAMYSTRGRGFQGFKAISIDEDLDDGHDKSVRTAYHDEFPLTGIPLHVQTHLRSDPAGSNPLSESLQDWAYVQRGDGTYFAHPTGTSEIAYDVDREGRPKLTESTTLSTYSTQDLANGNAGGSESTVRTYHTDTRGVTTLAVENRTQVDYDYDYGVVSSGWFDKLSKKTTRVFATDYAGLAGPRPGGQHNGDKVVAEDYNAYQNSRRLLLQKTVQQGIANEQRGETYQYDDFGNVTSVTLGAPGQASRATETVYSNVEHYFPNAVVDAKGFRTAVGYSRAFGRMEYQLTPDGAAVETQLDFAGNPINIDPHLRPRQWFYPEWCNGGCGVPNAIFKTTVVQDGQPTQIAYADVLGRRIRLVSRGASFDANGTPRDTHAGVVYDARGRKLSESRPAHTANAHLTQYSDYDALGRYGRKVVSRAGHAVASQTWLYDHQGLETTITLPGGTLTARRRYDASGRLLETTDAENSTTHHRYDGLGNKLLTENTLGTQVRHYFDNLGRKVKVEDPDAGTPTVPAELITYDGFGQARTSTNARGQTVATIYDVLRRPLARKLDGETVATWVYDENLMPSLSRIEGDANADGEIDYRKSFTYDEYNRPVKSELALAGSPRTFVDRVGYDSYYGRVKGRRLASGEVVLSRYDAHGNLNAEQQWWDAAGVGQEYYRITERNARGQVKSIVYGSGASASFAYVDSTGDVASMRYDAPNGTDLTDLRYFYGDAFGNLTKRQELVGGVTETFAYDDLQRLSSSNTVWTDPAIQPRGVAYDYDEVGNLLLKSDFGSTYHYGNVARDAGAAAGPHAVRRVDRPDGGAYTDFAYDASGNMTAGMNRSIVYDAFNKPIQIGEAGKISRYRYGPGFDLVAREEGGTVVYYGDSYQLVIGAGNAQSERSYIGAHAVIEKSAGARKVRYQHLDRLGSPVLVTDERGAATERHGFDAFGKPLEGDWQDTGGLLHSGTTGSEQLTEKGYTGHEHLDDHKLVHMGGRIYDPRLGRFMSVDPFIQSQTSTQSQNAYTYVMNNPLSMIDPSGFSSCSVADAEKGICSVQKFTDENGVFTHTVTTTNGKEGVTVTLADANGNVIGSINGRKGPDGSAAVTVTDADGRSQAVGSKEVFDWIMGCLDDGPCGWATGEASRRLANASAAAAGKAGAIEVTVGTLAKRAPAALAGTVVGTFVAAYVAMDFIDGNIVEPVTGKRLGEHYVDDLAAPMDDQVDAVYTESMRRANRAVDAIERSVRRDLGADSGSYDVRISQAGLRMIYDYHRWEAENRIHEEGLRFMSSAPNYPASSAGIRAWNKSPRYLGEEIHGHVLSKEVEITPRFSE